ncbi:hypothetical protein [Parvibaculum sp.]|uniref:Acg family FMN-binding oxidoreductase n=1 Tax=Parvibaculum sp. TaxID=2024848 RepID=UPI000C985391|nr:hypothetical protein [Parvibaculum sp.]MAB13064.1 hypothetical protein [Parvibaculum sp.]
MATKHPTRRNILKIGGGITLVAAGGLLWRAEDRGVFTHGEGPAYSAWGMWNAPEYKGTPFALVAAAVLASNPHNTQPWYFRVTDTSVSVEADRARHLGSMDPYLREMHIGLGCAIENMMLAAPVNGFAATPELQTGSLAEDASRSGRSLAAIIHLAKTDPASEPSPLHDAIARRHTDRGPYDHDRNLPDGFTGGLASLANGMPDVHLRFIADGDARERIDSAIVNATTAIVADDDMLHDSNVWFRNGPDDIEKHKSGITLDTAGMPPGILAAAKMLPPLSAETSHRAWLNATQDVHVPSAAAMGVIAVADRHDIKSSLEAGRLWQRIHLTAALAGVAMQPLNQPVEMADRDKQLGRAPDWEKRISAFSDEGFEPTFCFRMGMPTRQAPASPRRPVDEVSETA